MRRHPLFVLDSREAFEPVAVEAAQDIAKIDTHSFEVDALPATGGRMNFPPNPRTWAPELQAKYGDVGYLRRVEAGGLVWLLYFLFFLDNPKAWGGYGRHEGDWETVQIGYAGPTPVCVTASQHHGGEARMWWDVETRDGRPVIYVARDSHANYFEPVRGSIADDVCDGKGKVLDPEWRAFGSWATWPGRWGASTGVGESPESPGCQHQRWATPHFYNSQAR